MDGILCGNGFNYVRLPLRQSRVITVVTQDGRI